MLNSPAPPEPSTKVGVDLERKMKEFCRFIFSVLDIKEKIFYFKDQNRELQNKKTEYKFLSTNLKYVKNFMLIAMISTSVTCYIACYSTALIVVIISTAVVCGLMISKTVTKEKARQKYKSHRKQFERIQQLKLALNIYRNCSKHYRIDKEDQTFRNIFSKYENRHQNDSFVIMKRI